MSMGDPVSAILSVIDEAYESSKFRSSLAVALVNGNLHNLADGPAPRPFRAGCDVEMMEKLRETEAENAALRDREAGLKREIAQVQFTGNRHARRRKAKLAKAA